VETSSPKELAKKVPKAYVVSAFNTVPSEVLFSVFERKGTGARPSIVYCGENAKAKKVAAQLISDAGFEPIDAGPLRIARYTEPFTLLVGQLAYEGDRGPAMAYRFEWFEEREA
jgi:predicted dinucleotide-binding enzyme